MLGVEYFRGWIFCKEERGKIYGGNGFECAVSIEVWVVYSRLAIYCFFIVFRCVDKQIKGFEADGTYAYL